MAYNAYDMQKRARNLIFQGRLLDSCQYVQKLQTRSTLRHAKYDFLNMFCLSLYRQTTKHHVCEQAWCLCVRLFQRLQKKKKKSARFYKDAQARKSSSSALKI